MAKGQYIANLILKTGKFVSGAGAATKAMAGLTGATAQSTAQTKKASLEFLSFGATMLGTATSLAYVGGAVEKAMFRSRLAIERTGASAEVLADQIHAAGRSATDLLSVGATFAQLDFSAAQMAELTNVAFEMSRVMGITEKEAANSLAGIAAAAGIKTVPAMQKLASGIAMVSRTFPDFSKGNAEMLRTLAPTAVQMGIGAGALSGLNVAFQRAGVSAAQTRTVISEVLENFRYGPEQITSFATAMGLPVDQFKGFESLNPSEQFQKLFTVMQEGGMVTRENVPMLMSYLGVTKETGDAMVNLAASGADLNEIFALTNGAFSDGTTLNQEYNKWTKTLSGATDELWQSLKAIAEESAPMLTEALKWLTEVAKGVLETIKGLSPETRGWIVAIMGVVGAGMLVVKVLSMTGLWGILVGLVNILVWVAGVILGTVVPALFSMAAAGLAAIAPFLPFIIVAALVIAAAVAIGYALGKLISFIADNWTVIWAGAKNLMLSVWEAIKSGWDIIVGFGQAIVQALIAPFLMLGDALSATWDYIVQLGTSILEWLIAPITTLWDLLMGAGDAIAAPFKAIWEWLSPITDGIAGIVGWLFGSSMFHIKEGAADVMPSLGRVAGAIGDVGKSAELSATRAMPALGRMEGAFTGVGRAAGKVGLESHVPDEIRVRVEEPLRRRATDTEDARVGTQAFGGPAGSGGADTKKASGGGGGGGEGGGGGAAGGTLRVVVPVTLKLNGRVLAKAVKEYEVDTGRDLKMDHPSDAMRGTGR